MTRCGDIAIRSFPKEGRSSVGRQYPYILTLMTDATYSSSLRQERMAVYTALSTMLWRITQPTLVLLCNENGLLADRFRVSIIRRTLFRGRSHCPVPDTDRNKRK